MLTASPQYLIKRRQTYRRPLLPRPVFGRLELIISLKTMHFQDTKRLATRYDDYFDQLIVSA